MNQSILTGKTGVRAQQQRLDIIGNNLSNVNTTGYKTVRADFKEALYQTLKRPVAPQDELNLELGHGVLLGATNRSFTTGGMQSTGNPLDVMISGQGFFAAMSPTGETQYTRNGSFTLSSEADGQFLTTAQGWYVLSDQGERIQIQGSLSDLVISPEGNLSQGEQAPYAKLGMKTFDNLNGLNAVGNSMFEQTVASGEPVDLEAGVEVKQGYIEMSNTDLANEMSRMIRTQRALQLSSRAITTADQMMGIANNIRRG